MCFERIDLSVSADKGSISSCLNFILYISIYLDTNIYYFNHSTSYFTLICFPELSFNEFIVNVNPIF
jgi:hypothetical protein